MELADKRTAVARLTQTYKEGFRFHVPCSLAQLPEQYAMHFLTKPPEARIAAWSVGLASQFLAGINILHSHTLSKINPVDAAEANLKALANDNKPRIDALLTKKYKIVNRDTDMSPPYDIVAAVSADIDLLSITDRSPRILIKVYNISRTLSSIADTGDEALVVSSGGGGGALVEIANEIAISTALNALVTGYARCATPHFAYTFDWFPGPTVRKYGFAPDYTWEHQTISQYVVTEWADRPLRRMLVTPNASWRHLGSMLFQILFSLEAAWQLTGYVHNNLTLDNIAMRFANLDPKSPFSKRTWQYKRADRPGYYSLQLIDHGAMFIEITGNERARALVKASDGARVIVGNPNYRNAGLDGNVDTQSDVRYLALNFLFDIKLDFERKPHGSANPAYDAKMILEILATALDIDNYCAAVLAAADTGGRIPVRFNVVLDACRRIVGKSEHLAPDAKFRLLNHAIATAVSVSIWRDLEALTLLHDKAFYNSRHSNTAYTVTSALDHVYFSSFVRVVPDPLTAILAGLVRHEDTLVDPARSPVTHAERDAQNATTQCAFCSDAARGMAVGAGSDAHYCGAHCMASAHYGI